MATNFEIANFNINNEIDKYIDFWFGDPQYVTVQKMNADGTITELQQANVAQFRQKTWDDVGAALGQFNRIFYVDQVNGDDTNEGDIDYPFKSLWKAMDSIPSGGSGIIVLKNDLYMSGEPQNPVFSDKRIEIRLRGYKLVQDSTDKFISAQNRPGYIKIYSDNGYVGTIELQNEYDLIRAVDTTAEMIIGDYDSNLNVNYTGDGIQKLCWFARSTGSVFANRTAFNGNGVAQCLIATKDNDYVDVRTHATCTLDKVVTINYNNFIITRNSSHEGSLALIYIDPVDGNDSNPGTLDYPIKSFEEFVQRHQYFKNKKINIYLKNDLIIENSLNYIYNCYIEIFPLDNNINSAQTLTIRAQDVNGDGVYGNSVALKNSVMTIRCPLVFENPNASSGIMAACLAVDDRSSFSFLTGCVDDDGNTVNTPIIVKDYAKAIYSSKAAVISFYGADFQFETANTILYQNNATTRLNVISCTMDGGDFDTTTFWDHVSGVRVSPNPNILTSLNLPSA